MKTRCRECGTTFRVTPEQLKAKSGAVRCGQCLAVFNAFDTLITEEVSGHPVRDGVPALTEAETLAPVAEDTPALIPPAVEEARIQPEPEFNPEFEPDTEPELEPDTEPELEPDTEPDTEPELEPDTEPELEPASSPPAPADRAESIEESTAAAREVGLVAARELSELPSYNRWAEGTLTGNSLASFETEARTTLRWPYVLASVILLAGLLGQLLFHFRTELALRMPTIATVFEALAVDVPFPRNSDLVTIEASDLQADKARGLLLLQATLFNRAGYAQAWPALELSLTDTQDAVIARRVLLVNDYHATHDTPPSFPAQTEYPLRLALDAGELGAAGYRLHLFYP